MTLFAWGAVLILLGVFCWLYLVASARLDEEESWAELRKELDRAVPVWSRLPLYDWSARPDFNDPWGDL